MRPSCSDAGFLLDAVPLRHGTYAALAAALVLAACSELPLQREEIPATTADPAYNQLVANHIKNAFKDRASYDAFEVSAFRWVHSLKGWSWLACVRFQDRGHPRTYAVFARNGMIVEARYAVQTDACENQVYSPFDPVTGALRPTRAGLQEPLY